METLTFSCAICGDSSTRICTYCTKDTCSNHLCERCWRCSDCCTCEVPLGASVPAAVSEIETVVLVEEDLEPVLSEEDEPEDPIEDEEDDEMLSPSSESSELL